MRFFILLIFFWNVGVQALQGEITEISPHKVNDQEEWFEFSVFSSGSVDMTGWKIQNQNGTTKHFSDFADRLEGPHEDLVLSAITEEKIYFSWSKSPLSLPNDGGEIFLLSETDEVLDHVIYPKTKSGTSGGVKYAEIWNRKDIDTLVPLVFRDDPTSPFTHTKGAVNHQLPTLPSELEIRISEVSPQRRLGPDFIELVVLSGPEEVNLKYMTVKHNGTKLWEIESDVIISPGDYVLIHLNDTQEDFVRSAGKIEKYTTARDGLSAGSGTIELILFSGTSLETTVDFLCYKNEILSQTEANRVEKNIELGAWEDECVEIREQIENESVARFEGFGDSNTAQDWFRHFNGSPGDENTLRNEIPLPVIRVQGSGKISGAVPFSLNLTGEDSIDPDGDQDLKSFTWSINGEIFSDRENPLNYKIETAGDHEIVLAVEDYSGAVQTEVLSIKTWDPGSGGSGFGSQKIIEAFFALPQASSKEAEKMERGFFDEFLEMVSDESLEQMETKKFLAVTPKPFSYFPQLKHREKFIYYHPKETVLEKNIGIVFTEQ